MMVYFAIQYTDCKLHIQTSKNVIIWKIRLHKDTWSAGKIHSYIAKHLLAVTYTKSTWRNMHTCYQTVKKI